MTIDKYLKGMLWTSLKPMRSHSKECKDEGIVVKGIVSTLTCLDGGIGSHAGLKIQWSVRAVRVRLPLRVLKLKQCVKTNLQADVLIYQYESASTISTLESGMDPYKWVPSTLQVCRG